MRDAYNEKHVKIKYIYTYRRCLFYRKIRALTKPVDVFPFPTPGINVSVTAASDDEKDRAAIGAIQRLLKRLLLREATVAETREEFLRAVDATTRNIIVRYQ